MCAYQPAWQNRRTPPPDEATRAKMRANTDRNIAESKAAGYGPANFDDLLKPTNKKLGKQVKDIFKEKIAEARDEYNKTPKHGGKMAKTKGEVKAAAKAHKRIWADVASTCFSELSWKDGIATGTFINKTAGDWDWPCDLETFLEWSSDSLGEFFNAEIR